MYNGNRQLCKRTKSPSVPPANNSPCRRPRITRPNSPGCKSWPPNSARAGKEIVVVVGLGFVGAVMAAVVADATDKKGRPTKFVIGMQRPSTRSFWKIPLLNRGVSPVKAEDPEVERLIARCVNEKQDAGGHLHRGGAEAGRRGGGGRPVRLPQGIAGQRPHRRGRHGGAGGLDGDHRREHPASRAGPDRNHRRPGHHRADRLPDHEEDLREARHPLRAAAGPQLRARHARPELRGLDPRFLARLQRRQRRPPASASPGSSTTCSTPRSSR